MNVKTLTHSQQQPQGPKTHNVRRRSSDRDKQMDGWTCSLGVCLYVLETLEVGNLARN